MSAITPDRSRRWLWTGVALYAALILVVAVALWALQNRARGRLEDALGQRLLSVAVTAVHLVDGDSLRVWAVDDRESLELEWLKTRLERVRAMNGLSALTLCDPSGVVVASSAPRLGRGEFNLYWDLELDAPLSAAEGFAAAGGLVRVGDVYQKSAHAPVFDAEGRVTGVLSVEAEADFFAALAALRRGALLTLVLVLAGLTVLGLLMLRLQRSLVRARLEMLRHENLAMMGRMTAGIAHEIRNPLGIIRGAGEIQAERLRELGEDLPTLDFVTEEVDRLDRILTRYLTFGKGGGRIELEPTDLSRLVERVVRMATPELAADGIELVLDDRTGGVRVTGDSPGLQQLLLNLLFNARDAQGKGGRIETRLELDGAGVRLSVLDEGPGLGGLSQDELFEPFRTTKEKGSGLGLAVVRQVAEEHGGTVRLADRPDGRGAVAEVRLPDRLEAGGGED